MKLFILKYESFNYINICSNTYSNRYIRILNYKATTQTHNYHICRKYSR